MALNNALRSFRQEPLATNCCFLSPLTLTRQRPEGEPLLHAASRTLLHARTHASPTFLEEDSNFLEVGKNYSTSSDAC